MDDPALDDGRHAHALSGLRRLNLVSGAVRSFWSPIATFARGEQRERLRILDIATGGGDIPVGLWQRARRAGLDVRIDACDRSARALEHAAARAARAGAEVRFFELDAIRDPIPEGYDVIISSLFLHHLSTPDTRALLQRMAEATARLVIINDLVRSLGTWLLVLLGTRVLTRSGVVHADGPQSVRAAYTIDEIRGLAWSAGLRPCVIKPRWPSRFLLVWRRP